MISTFDITDQKCIAFADRYRTKKGFAKAFRTKFECIVVYHATKIDLKEHDAILSEGMRRTTTTFLYDKAISRFILPTDDPDQQQEILAGIDSYFEQNRFITVGEINFSIDRKLLLNECYHYLFFGPESLLPVADALRKDLKIYFRSRLVDFGSPVIISAYVPVSLTADLWLETLFEYMTGDWPETSLVLKAEITRLVY
ncbi:MAG: hypothetical protein EOP48_15890 [Sphingobacteriales bacterium]|nr:MAG: hypothetical protein EOP48_15890 [Sphingobacteriales bacterium]